MERMNLVCLTGNLTKDIVLEKVGKDQTSKASFTLAVSRDYKNSKGEYETDFPKVTVWRNSADYLAKYAGKGNVHIAFRYTSSSKAAATWEIKNLIIE